MCIRDSVKVDAVDVSVPLIYASTCGGANYMGIHHVKYHSVRPPDYTFVGQPMLDGDSGAIVLNSLGQIVAMHQWSDAGTQRVYGGGVLASYIRTYLGFTKWYGTTTFPNNTQVCQ